MANFEIIPDGQLLTHFFSLIDAKSLTIKDYVATCKRLLSFQADFTRLKKVIQSWVLSVGRSKRKTF